MQKFDASVPRKMFWSKDVNDNLQDCPECGSPLSSDSQVYVLSVRHGSEYEPFSVGNDDGYFCSNCPTVVLDFDAFQALAVIAADEPEGAQFAVAGIIDLKAIPEEKSHLPLGEDDNPIPLVDFLENYDVMGSVDSREMTPPKNREGTATKQTVPAVPADPKVREKRRLEKKRKKRQKRKRRK